MARATIGKAKSLADQWKAQREEHDNAPSAAYFGDADAYDLIAMWKSGKNFDGKKLTRREFGCLVERWVEVFGDLPASSGEAVADSATEHVAPLPEPADDTMLRVDDVVRLTGLSHSTIKRMISDGRFPKHLRIGERAKGWLARDVKAWIEALNEQRRRPRQ
ncbi:helix-turn-helix transcriptional regulator [Hyphomicrobium methylovorum]|uniref:helix-turn-helix transcriptional regulator n=1 Tax=Hyphomicrobium methylovorum TaxID=84 RepID=UPI001AED4D5F|nr:AlpA family phage regulatory protein [Hyphomicrobium methylovorum]